MAKERCVKKSFQDSLEDIKERMKEKRTKKLAKVATVNKGLSTKVKIINNSTATVKSFQANNKALALALEAEKCKTRQAQDLVLHLKREHQRLMFEIFILKRKLNLQQGNSSSEAKLASLKEIITKVTHNLLETANLLGPAHTLCSSDGSVTSTPASVEVKRTGPPPLVAPESLEEMCEPASDAPRDFRHVSERGSIPRRRSRQEETSEKITSGKRIPKARTSGSSQAKSDLQKSEQEAEYDNSLLRNVSVRRRASSLNVCIEESLIDKTLEKGQDLNSRCDVTEAEVILPAEECLIKASNDEIMGPDQSPSKEDFIPFANNSQISSSTPEPKPKPSQSLKSKTESRPGREKVRKSKAEGQVPVPLKKPWEKSRPRARSKSRDRSANRQVISKDKINSSLNSGDAYDFVFEESVHVTPFRQDKLGRDPDDNEEPIKDQSNKSGSSSSDEELNSSLYVPGKARSTAPLPLRPRSKRNKDSQQQYSKKTENKSDQDKPDFVRGKKNTRSVFKGSLVTEMKPATKDKTSEESKENILLQKCVKTEENGKLSIDVATLYNPMHSTDWNLCESAEMSAAQRISLSNVTNVSTSSGSTESKKHSFPFPDDNRKMSAGFMRKRRCTVTVNYAEPSLNKKLRRGDPFTDTEFLLSPVFKNNDPNCKSINRKSLARYNEAFVGCR